MQTSKNLIAVVKFLLASNYGIKINTKNYADLMCFIKMCEKSRIYNFKEQRVHYIYTLKVLWLIAIINISIF